MNVLDAEELFYLALKEVEEGNREKSILYLKQSISLDAKPESLFLLGAEYAEIGMYDRAIAAMSEALTLAPELWTAWFQLGLLYLTQELAEAATDAFSRLAQLGAESCFFHFGDGMTKLVGGELEQAVEALELGLSLNLDNPALNRDVSAILNSLANMPELQAEDEVSDGIDPAGESGYQQSSNENKTLTADAVTDLAFESASKEPSANHLLLSKYRNHE